MENILKKVGEELEKGDVGTDSRCEWYPCHHRGMNCTFCYCPFYYCYDESMGSWITSTKGKRIWSCEDCNFIHRDDVTGYVLKAMKERDMKPGDPRLLSELFPEVKARFQRRGKALMVVGATSDAGKSLTVAAICRVLNRRGYSVAPFKSQNMSLNSKVTVRGEEMAMIQMLQSKAAGNSVANIHMNPILLKPKGDAVSQVMAEGKPFADYDVKGYYEEFVPGPGREIVRRNVDYLLDRYDYVVMEGAGSPAEINIYDRDIANMRAAEIADADCILVVNVEWGGSFAYALGTVELLPEEDRRRVKGIILNNVRGDPERMRDGAKKLEEACGVPVIGIVPHMDLNLPREDSEAFRSARRVGTGERVIAVIRTPRIANFTDLDPLYSEDVTVVFADTAEDVENADAIVMPGTKDTIDDLKWMRARGIDRAVLAKRGKVPILGICGGYQMMGKTLHDPNGIESSFKGDTPGLGLFDNVTVWRDYTKRVVRETAEMVDGGGAVEGYEIHMGIIDPVVERPLFRITSRGRKGETEGSERPEEMLFGTFLHGCLDMPAFRERFLSLVKHDGKPVEEKPPADYDAVVEDSLDRLADGFERSVDMDALMRIAGAVPRARSCSSGPPPGRGRPPSTRCTAAASRGKAETSFRSRRPTCR